MQPSSTEASTDATAIRLGTQGWAYKDWVGVFYPEGTRPVDYLSFYSKIFNTVELDTTFYGPPRPETVRLWAEKTPDDFVFTAKMPRTITHDRKLTDPEAELVEFLTAMQALDKKLGPILVQLPPSFASDEYTTLERFVRMLPEEFEYAIEFRHRSWVCAQTFDLLTTHKIAWTIIDLHYMPSTMEVTAPFTYIRWLGKRSDVRRLDRIVVDRTDDLDDWALELDRISEQVLRIYGFINNHYAGHSPTSVRDLKHRLRQETVDPQTLWPQQRLFF